MKDGVTITDAALAQIVVGAAEQVEGVRVDTAVEDGAVVPPYYDSLIAKLIVWDADRGAAIRRAVRALGELEVDGVPTTRETALEILQCDEFRSGEYSTTFLEERMAVVS